MTVLPTVAKSSAVAVGARFVTVSRKFLNELVVPSFTVMVTIAVPLVCGVSVIVRWPSVPPRRMLASGNTDWSLEVAVTTRAAGAVSASLTSKEIGPTGSNWVV